MIGIKWWSKHKALIHHVDAARFIERDSLHNIQVQIRLWSQIRGRLRSCFSCAQPPYLNLLEDNIPEEYPEARLDTETGVMTDKEFFQGLQQLNDLRLEKFFFRI